MLCNGLCVYSKGHFWHLGLLVPAWPEESCVPSSMAAVIAPIGDVTQLSPWACNNSSPTLILQVMCRIRESCVPSNMAAVTLPERW